MGFLVSPGVEVKEIDLTNVIPALSTSIGGFAGEFKWGPVDELRTVSSENDLAEIFGKPDATVSKGFLQAAGFLKYGNTLKVSRAVRPLSAGGQITPGLDTLSAVAANLGSASTETSNTPKDPAGDLAKVQIKNLTHFYATQDSIPAENHFIARCPGANGNSLKVMVVTKGGMTKSSSNTPKDPTNADQQLLIDNFDAAPGSLHTFVKDDGSSVDVDDEVHVLIIDENGLISGTPNNVVEKFQGLSLLSDATNADGSSNYYYDVINNTSQFVYVNKLGNTMFKGGTVAADNDSPVPDVDADLGADLRLDQITAPIASNTTDTIANVTNDLATDDSGYFAIGLYVDRFTGGDDGIVNSAGYMDAIDLFEDVDTVDVNLLMAGAGILDAPSQVTVDNDLILCATTRKDCVAFVSPGVGAGSSDDEGLAVEKQTTENLKLTAVTKRRTQLTNMNSYAFMDSSPLYVYNKYADNYEFIAGSGHIAGLCARTDGTNDPWFSPAGFNRGNLLSITKLAFNPNQSSRDTLYKNQINPIVSFPGQGIVLFGDKTGQVKASAFDRINVRRLFIVLEKAISTASKFSLFELNDEFTRAQFRNLVEPFLRDVKGRRGITDFLVVCDETNNTGQVIDTNRFVADIYIKPARSINFITLNFVATRTGVEFSEVVGG